MLENRMSRSPSWQQSLLLVALGAAVGYPSFVNMDLWGGTTSRYQNLFILGFFAGTVAFMVGFASFLTIAFKSVKSSPLESAMADLRGTSTNPTSNVTPVRQRPHAIPARGVVNNGGMVLGALLRITLAATVGLACFSLLRDWGQPPLTSSYGRSYWLNALLSLLLSQLPFAIALIRTWKIPDHAGLALATATATMRIVVNVPYFLTLMNLPGMRSSWSPLEVMMGVTVVALACLAWRASGPRGGDVGLVVSIFFGFLGYTVIWRSALGVLVRP